MTVLGFASLAYSMVPGFDGGLRRVVWLKVPLIAGVWATATTLHMDAAFDPLLWAQRFVFIASLTLPFDIRDLNVDEHHIQTVASLKSPKWVLQISRRGMLYHAMCAADAWERGMHTVGPDLLGAVVLGVVVAPRHNALGLDVRERVREGRRGTLDGFLSHLWLPHMVVDAEIEVFEGPCGDSALVPTFHVVLCRKLGARAECDLCPTVEHKQDRMPRFSLLMPWRRAFLG